MALDPKPPSQTVLGVRTSSADSKRSFTSWVWESEETLSVVKFFIGLLLGAAVIYVALQSPNDILRSRVQFRSWFNQYSYQFNLIAKDNCTAEYSIYLYGTRQNTSDQTLTGAGQFTLFVQPMINCLLDNAGGYIQYQLSSSQVLLGITPTIIAVLGTSSEEVCFVALIGRRRLLGLLLATASPSIYTERAFKYQNPDEILKERLGAQRVKSTRGSSRRWFFVLLEYVFVLAAIVNIATLNWTLGMQTVNSLNPNSVYMPMMWSLLGVIAHVMGAVVFHMRVRQLDEDGQFTRRSTLASSLKAMVRPSQWPAISEIYHTLKRFARREFDSQPKEPEERLQYAIVPESRCFTFLAWLLSVLIIFHIILGTFILSSTNFVGPKDALGILARYILSVIICRVIVVCELAVQRVDVTFETSSNSDGYLYT